MPPGASEDLNWKRAPNGLGASGFYGDVFNQGFGAFSPVKRGHQLNKRRSKTAADMLRGDALVGGRADQDTKKRRPEMTASGFYDDVFRGGMGHFEPMKRRPEMTASGFYDDVFRGGMGHFEPMKRRPEMSASGFYDDVFRGDMGHFEPMKRRPEMSASGFYDDVFRGGMGHFDTMKRVLVSSLSKEHPGVLSHVRIPTAASRTATEQADEHRAKRNGGDEVMTAKGLRGELPAGSLEEFSTMR